MTGGATGGRGGATSGQAIGALGYLMAGTTTTVDVTGSRVITLPNDIAGPGGLTKTGTGTLVLAAANTYAEETAVNAGALLLTVTGSAAGPVSVAGGATLGGSGTIGGTVNVAAGGTLAPGDSSMLATGPLTLNAGSVLAIDIREATAGSGYDQVRVSGGVRLGGVTLGATLAVNASGLVLPGPRSFIIVDNDGSDPVTGTFAGLPEGATFAAGAYSFQITYSGGTGNDVVLTSALSGCAQRAVAPLPPGIERLPYFTAPVLINSVGSVTWTVSGALPPGLVFNGLVFAGTPALRGAFPLTITGRDAEACEASATVTLSISAERRLIAGGGSGGLPTVRAFNLSGPTPVLSFHTDGAGSVPVAQGDLNRDGIADIISGAGRGSAPLVRAFDGRTGAPLLSFFAFDPSMSGGVDVAAGDVTGDGVADILAAAGCGGPFVVRAFDGRSGALVREYSAGSPAWSCGLHVAAGDVNGDGIADIVVGSAQFNTPAVRVLDGATGSMLRELVPYAPPFTGGVYVAAGDLTGDGFADIVTGAGPGGGPHVRVFDGRTGAPAGGSLASFFAYDAAFSGGVRVAAGDLNGDGRAELITGAGPGGGPHVRVFDGAGGGELLGFFAFDPAFPDGTYVAAPPALGRMSIDLAATGPGAPNVHVGGWALKEIAIDTGGTDAIHVWAAPVTGGAPVFLGAATSRAARSDVASTFGGEFLMSGFDVTGTLAPGTYDLYVFVRNSRTLLFDQLRIVRITVN